MNRAMILGLLGTGKPRAIDTAKLAAEADGHERDVASFVREWSRDQCICDECKGRRVRLNAFNESIPCEDCEGLGVWPDAVASILVTPGGAFCSVCGSEVEPEDDGCHCGCGVSFPEEKSA